METIEPMTSSLWLNVLVVNVLHRTYCSGMTLVLATIRGFTLKCIATIQCGLEQFLSSVRLFVTYWKPIGHKTVDEKGAEEKRKL